MKEKPNSGMKEKTRKKKQYEKSLHLKLWLFYAVNDIGIVLGKKFLLDEYSF